MALSLSDFIDPKNSKVKDYVGAFAVTAGINAEELSLDYENNKNYREIALCWRSSSPRTKDFNKFADFFKSII